MYDNTYQLRPSRQFTRLNTHPIPFLEAEIVLHIYPQSTVNIKDAENRTNLKTILMEILKNVTLFIKLTIR